MELYVCFAAAAMLGDGLLLLFGARSGFGLILASLALLAWAFHLFQ